MALQLSYGVRFMDQKAVNDLINCGFIPQNVGEVINGNITMRSYNYFTPYYPLDDTAYVDNDNGQLSYIGNWVRTDIANANPIGPREYYLHPPVAFEDIKNYNCVETAGYPKYPSGSRHKGVDWANGIYNLNIDVCAVDYGRVLEVRDGCNCKYFDKDGDGKRDNVVGTNCGTTYHSGGNKVRIMLNDGTIVDYMHLKENSICVVKDDYVNPCDKIGVLGTTGRSTGLHLHFQRNNANDDPISPYKHLIMFYDINENIEPNWKIAKQSGKTYTLNQLLLL